MPGNAVAGQVYKIDVHAGLADGKAAAAGPGKRRDLTAAVALSVSCAPPLLPEKIRFFS